jgi:hypothetical protein
MDHLLYENLIFKIVRLWEHVVKVLEQNNLLEQKVNLLEQKNKILRKSILLREYIRN